MSSPPATPAPDVPSPAPPAGRTRRWLLGGAALLAVALMAVGLAVRAGLWQKGPPAEDDPFPLHPLSTSPFLNTGPEARYVGSAACRPCHRDHETSFHRTGMGRSMAEIDLSREPPDADFDHPLSKRRYEVRRKDGQLWHRELLLTEGPDEVLLCAYPLKYVVGSGRHSLTYLVEADGFLVESPLTWYTSKKAWAMSPGYDSPHQAGFERAVGEGCLVCHAGQAEAVGGSLHRMSVGEAAIGCERCHGPGSLHVERHAGRKLTAGKVVKKIDHTIVNPARLSRELGEAICQQCHLRSGATITARGRKPGDFRPGLPLQDFRHDYRLEVPGAPMTVVGHVEQMHLSRCYQASESLSCLTCHDPHDEPRPAEAHAHYNAVCQECHKPQRCKVAPARRQKESPENSCIHCHMPTSPTEIPHLAFTHHRIGVHTTPASPKGPDGAHQGLGALLPVLPLPPLSDIDRKWSLGLGYLEVANRQRNVSQKAIYQQRALGLLSEAHSAGLREPALEASLARLYFDLERDAQPHAESALSHPGLIGQDRCNALFLLADAHASRGRHEEAVAALRQVVNLRRHPVDWLLLADCERALGHPSASIQALEQAVRINPRHWQAQQQLAEHYRRQGDTKRATWHQRRAVR